MTSSQPERIVCRSREEWLAVRRTGIGASEIAAVLGFSPWSSPFALWAQKTGVADDGFEESTRMAWGRRLESAVRDGYVEETGRDFQSEDVDSPFVVYRDADEPWLLATPDGKVYATDRVGVGLGEIKVTDARFSGAWDDGPPLYYVSQVQQGMAVTRREWASFGVLVGGNDLRVFDLDFDPEFAGIIREKAREFWRLVETRTPPSVDATEATKRALAAKFPRDLGTTVVLGDDALAWHRQKVEAEVAKKAAQVKIDEAANHIRALLGDATFGELPDGSRYKYALEERSAYTVAPSSSRVLRFLKAKGGK